MQQIISLKSDGLYVTDEKLVFGASGDTRISDEDFFKHWEKELNVSTGVRVIDLLTILQRLSKTHCKILSDIADTDVNKIIAAGLLKRDCEPMTDISSLVVSERIILKKTSMFDTFVKNIPARAHRSTPEITRHFYLEGKIPGPPEELIDISDSSILDIVHLPLEIEHAVPVDIGELIPLGPVQAHQAMSLSDFVLTVLDDLKFCKLDPPRKNDDQKPAREVDESEKGEEGVRLANHVEVITEMSKKEKKELKRLKKKMKKKMKKDIKRHKKDARKQDREGC